MAKYGTFMAPDLFGSKFFMGTVVKLCLIKMDFMKDV